MPKHSVCLWASWTTNWRDGGFLSFRTFEKTSWRSMNLLKAMNAYPIGWSCLRKCSSIWLMSDENPNPTIILFSNRFLRAWDMLWLSLSAIKSMMKLFLESDNYKIEGPWVWWRIYIGDRHSQSIPIGSSKSSVSLKILFRRRISKPSSVSIK